MTFTKIYTGNTTELVTFANSYGSTGEATVAIDRIFDATMIQLTATTAFPGQTVTINKYFANDYVVNRGDKSATTDLTGTITHTYLLPGTYIITLAFTGSANRWTFTQNPVTELPLVPKI